MVLSHKVNEGFMKCLDYPGTDDKIKAKIDRTNSLIHKLQHTLDRIRYRSQPDTSVQEVTTTDTETGKTISGTGISKSDEEIGSNQETEDKITIEVEPGIENVRSPKLSVVPYNETVISSRKPPLDWNEETTGHEDSENMSDKEKYESSRPKTRRNGAPEEVCNLDRFQNTPKVEEKTVLSSDIDLRVLQAKLNTIREQTESDLSFSSDDKPIAKEGVEVSSATSSTLKDSKSASSPTISVSVQCGNSPKLTNEQPQKFEISPKPLQKTTQLVVQLLPPVNITRGPAPQKLICFSINSLGKTSLQYKSDSQNVGYYQVDSPSLTQLRPSGQNKNQVMVSFIGVSGVPKSDSSQEIISKETNAAEPTSGINYIVHEFENKKDETPESISLPENVCKQTKCSPQSQQQSELTNISDEDSENHIGDDLHNAESSATSNRIKTSDARRITKDSLCDPKESSSFNLLDAAQEEERQRLKRNRQKSVSDPNIHDTIYGEYQRNMKRGISTALEKDLIFKSFQLFRNYTDHDPGSLSNLSTDLISNMDESVYKTYINPSGFHRHNLQGNTLNKDKKGPPTQAKMSPLKFVIPGSPKKQYEETDVDKENTEYLPATEPSENDSKVYNIGLYSSKSTQSTPPLDEVALNLKQLGKEYIPEVNSESSMHLYEPVSPENISYERISLTLSYSTEESSHSSTEQEHEVHVVEPVESKDAVIEMKEKKPKAPFVENPEDVKKFKQLKKKINEEHNIVPSDSHIDLSRLDCASDSISASIPAFITGLITSNPNELQRVIPLMRKTVQGAKRKLSVARTPEKAEDATDAKETSNKTYTVLPVHLQEMRGNPSVYIEHDPISVSPLQAGRNGRYKDEENIFCENNHPRMEETLERKFDYRPGNLHRREHRIDSSNSDTITSERTLSDGEIRCCCSASIGEMHRCEGKKVFNHRKSSPLQKEEKISIRKRKSYFNNLVTFYHNANASLVNDSSSTS